MSLFRELKRRNVFKVAAAYLLVAWLLMQVGDTLAPALHLPAWINSALALQEIERLIDTPGSQMTRWSLTLDPRWDFFRDDERFKELIRPPVNP